MCRPATKEPDGPVVGVDHEFDAPQRIEFETAHDDVAPGQHRIGVAGRGLPRLYREKGHCGLGVRTHAEEPVAANPFVGDHIDVVEGVCRHVAGGTLLGPAEVGVSG